MLSVVRNKKTKYISYGVIGVFLGAVLFGVSLPGTALAGGPLDLLGDTIADAFKGLLYAIWKAVGLLLSAAIGVFEYAVDPKVAYGPDGLFNKGSVYAMWKFIRDFFNLFFILTLLYTAFTIVFQIAGNYKKTLLSIVLAALFVNFSFPITRVIIDASNVPMYYFMNLIMTSKGGDATTNASGALGPALSASGLKDILIPKDTELSGMTVSQILMGIIFLFVFMVTLMVLSVLFAVRMMVLLVLVMFSSIGFAGSVIPGMKQYSDMWWNKLTQYALFGPAAMLMLYMATQLFSEISKDNTKQTMNLAIAANATAESSSFLASAGMYSITIIMLWIAIGLANSMSIVGAGAVAGKGQQLLKWVGRKSAGGIVYAPRKFASGVGQGVKSRFNDSSFGKFLAAPSRLEAYGKGVGKTVGRENIIDVGKTAQKEYKTELQKFHAQQVNKKVKENKENKINNSALIQELKTGDKIEKQAAALTLAENKAIDNLAVLKESLLAVGDDTDHVATIMKAASDKATGGLSAADFKSMTQSPAFAERKPDGTPKQDPVTGEYIVDGSENFKALKGKLKASGELNTLVEYEKAQNITAKKQDPAIAMNNALATVLGKLSGADLGKQESIHKMAANPAPENDQLRAYLKDIATNSQTTYQDALKNMSIESVKRWQDAGISPVAKATDEGARMREKMQQAKKETRERRG